jgi:RimJ/RimL family protein N-acetyltransferase
MGLLIGPAVAPGTMAKIEQPVIEGDGVVLRPWHEGDLDVVLAGYGDPAIQRWHVRSMDGEDEARAWIAQWPQRWQAETGAGWAVTLDGVTAVGQISLSRLDLGEGAAGISYWTLPQARGAGAAHRALVAMADWVFPAIGINRLQVAHSTANPASCRVAEKSGFPAEGVMRGTGLHADGWHDMHVHARIAADGENRAP